MLNRKLPEFSLKIIYMIILLAACINKSATAQTHVGGTVSGVWSLSNSPYIVDSQIFIEENTTLTIEPGVIVKFAENKYIMVKRDGKLTAIGEKSRKILFTSNKNDKTSGDWIGIKLIDTYHGVKIQNCIIEYADTGIYCEASVYGCDGAGNYTEIENCLIQYCNYGISCEGEGHSIVGCSIAKTGVCSPKIFNNQISNNTNDGVRLHAQSGYKSHGFCGAEIKNNVIRDNGGNGIYCYGGSEEVEPDVINNTIAYNEGWGIYFQENYNPSAFIIVNNLIVMNDIGLYAQDDKVPTIKYNNIWWNNQNYHNMSIPATNISANPRFFNESDRDLHLKGNSPCINAGDPNSDKDPDGSIADIGAFPYDENYVFIDHNDFILASFSMLQNYPNPFNPNTTISFNIPRPSNVTIAIFDINGRIVENIYNAFLQQGFHSIIWNASALSSGSYFIQLRAGEFVEMKKCILLK